MGITTDPAHELAVKVEVLQDLEGRVRELMESHERKRDLWFPSDLLEPGPDTCPDEFRAKLRAQAEGIPDHVRAALALNLLTEEGLPHFHRVLAVYLGDDSHWRTWNNLWTAEEDRHGAGPPRLRPGHPPVQSAEDRGNAVRVPPPWVPPRVGQGPYRVFAYTTVQERATQFSHSETGRIVSEYEPRLGEVLAHVAKDEARHYAFYRSVFEEILKRDPDQALHSASFILPAIDMPGVTMPGFKELAEVIRRAGIYGPRDYLRIVQEQIRYWKIEKLQGLGELGRIAQEKILGIPARLKRIAEHMETRSKAKTFSFEVVFSREFAME